MKMLQRVLLMNLFAVYLAAGVASAAAPTTKVVIAYSSLNERGAGALLVARDQGFFRKHDLDVSLIFMRSAAVALSALSAGEAQFYSGSANGSALGAMAGGLDLVFIAGLANQLNGTMVAAPSIQSPADLKRKNIAIQSIGGGVWMITQLVLEHWGLDPKRDGINLRIVGDESVMVQSLVLGTVDATYAGYAYQARRAVSEHGDTRAPRLSQHVTGDGGKGDPGLGGIDHIYPAARQQSGGGRNPDEKLADCAARGSGRRLRSDQKHLRAARLPQRRGDQQRHSPAWDQQREDPPTQGGEPGR